MFENAGKKLRVGGYILFGLFVFVGVYLGIYFFTLGGRAIIAGGISIIVSFLFGWVFALVLHALADLWDARCGDHAAIAPQEKIAEIAAEDFDEEEAEPDETEISAKADQLRLLKEQLDAGTITADVFAKRKREILDE